AGPSAEASLESRHTAGLLIATFRLPRGTIQVSFPDDMAAADVVSGTVTALAAPGGDEEATDELRGCVLDLEGQRSPVERPDFQWPIPGTLKRGTATVGLLDSQARPLGKLEVPVQRCPWTEGMRPRSFEFPAVALGGSPVQIYGPFDGSLQNTRVTAAGQSMRGLAESPRKAIVWIPAGPSRALDLVVQEGASRAAGVVRIVAAEENPGDPIERGTATQDTGGARGGSGPEPVNPVTPPAEAPAKP
ncbi:MAG TPA: hypothetical protein VNO81_12185, partial [Candidatus Nitrosotenuis sp.]|nr:hypothetical protein [Candidatus Nitrosotenuis sp.]